MPVSQILPNGKVRIYNNKTGEIRDVMPEDLATYNPRLVGEYEKLRVTNQKEIEKKTEPSADEKKKIAAKEVAERAVTQLENLYFKGGQTKGLASGRGGGAIETIKRVAGKNEQLNTYDSARESSRPTLARALGDVGNLSEQEQQAAIALLPTQFSTPEEAFAGFKEIRNKLALKKGDRLGEIEKRYKGDSMSTSAIPQQTPQKPSKQGSGVIDSLLSLGRKVASKQLSGGNPVIENLAPNFSKLFSAVNPRTSNLIQKSVAGENISGDIIPAGAEIGLTAASFFPPTASVAAPTKVASVASKIPALARILGSGALYGATEPGNLTPEERGQKALQGAVGSGATAGILKTPGAVVKSVIGNPQTRINQLFKPLESELNKFKRNTGLNFSEEVIKRDLPSIQGKTGAEILDYYTTKVDEFEGAADQFLTESGKTVAKNELVGIIDKQISKLGGIGRVLQSDAVRTLEALKKEIITKPGEIAAVEVNQLKRDIQTAGKSAFSPKGSSSASSNALEDVQRDINNLLQSKAPGIKEVNKSIQYYRLAKDSIEKQVNQSSKSEGSRVIQAIGATGGIGGLLTLMSNPALGATLIGGGGGSYLLDKYLRSPQFKTKAADVGSQQQKQVIPNFLKRLLELQGARGGSAL